MNTIDEQLSALMDGEKSDVNLVLKNMQDTDVRARWMHYHLIRDVMRNHVSTVDKNDISLKVQQAISSEPTVIAAPFKQKIMNNKSLIKQLGSMAIAATVTAVAILVVQQNSGLNNSQTTVVATKQATQLIAKNNVVTVSTRNIELNKAVAAKLNSYLVNHNEYAVSSGMQGAIPYTRVVNFHPTVKIVRSINVK